MFNFKDKLKKIKNKTARTLKNSKGVTSLEAVIGLIIVIIVIAGIVDFSNTNVQLSNISTVTDYMSRIVSEQGGISNSKPKNYYDEVYTTSQQAFQYVSSHLRNNGVEEWSLIINTPNGEYTFEENTNIPPLAYNSPVTIKLTFKHELKLLNGLLNIPAMTKNSTRSVKTTLHPRNEDLGVSF